MLRKDTVGKYNFEGELKKDNAIDLVNNSNASGWHFIGNPFPVLYLLQSFLIIMKPIFLERANNALFIFDEFKYTWQPLTKVNNAFIAPGQAFLLRLEIKEDKLKLQKIC